MTDDKKTNHDTPEKEIDKTSGVGTTGHEWDGIKELNNPLPRWWLWVFYITILWSIVYWVLFPAWPTLSGNTKGTLGYTQSKALEKSQEDIVLRQKSYLDKFEKASFQEILKDKELYAFSMAGGASFFKDNCATCHGTGADGSKGYPNLNDDDWLWGGRLEDIYQTIKYGARSGHDDAHFGDMPAFGVDEMLDYDGINSVVDYVLSLSGANKHDVEVDKGRAIFAEQCAMCHGGDAKGNTDFGAPNLSDKIWLYGGDRDSVIESVYSGRAGVMPAWEGRLDENTIRGLTVYLHQLGGGK